MLVSRPHSGGCTWGLWLRVERWDAQRGPAEVSAERGQALAEVWEFWSSPDKLHAVGGSPKSRGFFLVLYSHQDLVLPGYSLLHVVSSW